MSLSSSKQDVDRYVSQCVAHLQDHASHYLSLIQSKRVEGVLWAVFRVGERLLPQGAHQGVELHKASFLALSSMVSSKADVLLRMQRDCDDERQFVCWFTLDDAHGTALASKVLTIDAGVILHHQQVQENHGAHHEVVHPAPASRMVDDTSSSVISQFRQRNSERSASRGHEQHSASNAASFIPSGAHRHPQHDQQREQQGAHRQEQQGVMTGDARPRSPRTVRELLAAVGKTSQPMQVQQQVATPPPEQGSSNTAEAANVAMLMRMVMQVADSVASMGAAIDQISVRCANIESDVKTLKDRIHLVEVPMFGDDYDFSASLSAGGTRVGNSGFDARHKPHVAWHSADTNDSGVANGQKKRALLSASEMLIQLTELSLRVGETENRVRVLESSKESAELQRKLLHEQVDALKTRLADYIKISERRQDSVNNNTSTGSRHAMFEEQQSAPNDYPWRRHHNQPDTRGGDVRQGNESSLPTFEDANRQMTATSSSIAAATRMMESPFRGYTPPLTSSVHPRASPHRERHHPGYEEGIDTNVGRQYSHEHSREHAPATPHQQPGALTDMIRSLETRLGGIRAATR